MASKWQNEDLNSNSQVQDLLQHHALQHKQKKSRKSISPENQEVVRGKVESRENYTSSSPKPSKEHMKERALNTYQLKKRKLTWQNQVSTFDSPPPFMPLSFPSLTLEGFGTSSSRYKILPSFAFLYSFKILKKKKKRITV